MFEQRVRCFQSQYTLDRRVVKDLKVKNLEETSVQSRGKESKRDFPHFFSTKDHFLTLEDEFYLFKWFSRVCFILQTGSFLRYATYNFS